MENPVELKFNQGIYKIICLANRRFYLGRTVNFAKRRADHLRALMHGQHKNPLLQKCFDKYGIDYFQFVLIEVLPREEHISAEQNYLNTFVGKPECLNINKSALTCETPWDEARREKIAVTKRGRRLGPASQLAREAISRGLKGHHVTAETRAKIGQARRGKTVAEEHRGKSARPGSQNGMFGRTGEAHPTSRAVLQLDLETCAVVARHESGQQADEVIGSSRGAVSKICRRSSTAHTAGGSLWCFEDRYAQDLPLLRELSKRMIQKEFTLRGVSKPNARAVTQLDLAGGVLTTFPFLSAVRELGFDPSAVAKVCRGKGSTAYGFRWAYSVSELLEYDLDLN